MPSKNRKTTSRKEQANSRAQITIGASLVLLLLIGIVIPVSAMQLENHNSFCASCHTQDEEKFYNRATKSAPTDLASAHDMKNQARCIDCHTGPGIVGRYGGLMAGATDLISYFSGHYPQPAALEEPYPDQNCMKCHQTLADKKDFNNHFHVFLFQWQSIDPANAAHCVDCHTSHDTTNDAGAVFLNKMITIQVCQRCHASAGQG